MKNIRHITIAELYSFVGLTVIYYVTKLIDGIMNHETKPMVLCYHSVSNDGWRFSTTLQDFHQQMMFLKKKKKIVSLSTLLSLPKNQQKNCVAITFDDGYKDLHQAATYLANLNIPATLFVIGDPKNANRKELDNRKKLMSLQDIKKLLSNGWGIGFHTNTHANLTELTEEQLKQEITVAKKQIEEKLGTTLLYFAYPRGLYAKSVIHEVKRAGFKAAFTVHGDYLNTDNGQYTFSRVPMEAIITMKRFEALVFSPFGIPFMKHYIQLLSLKHKLSSISYSQIGKRFLISKWFVSRRVQIVYEK